MQISFALGWGKVVKCRLFKDFKVLRVAAAIFAAFKVGRTVFFKVLNPAARSFPPSRLGSPNKFDCSRLVVG